MEIRDNIHGEILVEAWELPILESPYFQRLRQIRQLGFAEHAFPSATHTRLIHSLGAMHTASQAFDILFAASPLYRDKLSRFKPVLRLAALLHDIGHGPLSHTSEIAMPVQASLKIPGIRAHSDQATHEDYTLKILLDSELTCLIDAAGKPFGFQAIHVAALIERSLSVADNFFLENSPEGNSNSLFDYRPILSQLISSELDADRMDYLKRDSTLAGVSYGNFDYDWLLKHLTYAETDNKQLVLSLQYRALYAFEDFLISRFHMFLMVYFHHKSVIYDEMLSQYFRSPDCEFEIPSSIEEYLHFDDYHLYAHLRRSKNPWARRIIEKRPYQMLAELHTGIPKNAPEESQNEVLDRIQEDLRNKKIHCLRITSTSELSKYFGKAKDPIFIKHEDLYHHPRFYPLEDCTNLFNSYRKKRSINRLYVSAEWVQKVKASSLVSSKVEASQKNRQESLKSDQITTST